MSNYAEILGRMEFTVSGVEYSLRPKKGDNLALVKLQKKAKDDNLRLIEDFIPFMVELINREERFDKDSEEYKDLELFVELNVMEFIKEVMIAFRWTTREKWEAQERKQFEGFQKGMTSPEA